MLITTKTAKTHALDLGSKKQCSIYQRTPDFVDEIWYGDEMNKHWNEPIVKLICSITGSYKTSGFFMRGVPRLVEKGVRLITYVVPQVSLISKNEVWEYIGQTSLPKWDVEIIDSTDDIDKKKVSSSAIGHRLNRRKIVILLVSDAMLRERKKDLLPCFKSLGKKFALCRDEIHWGTHSDEDWAEKAIGTKPKDFKGAMFSAIDELLRTTPFIYGLSATPTPEHREVYSDNFVIVNEWSSPMQYLTRTKHLDEVIEITPDNFQEQFDELSSAINKIADKRQTALRELKRYIREFEENGDVWSANLARELNCKFSLMQRCETRVRKDKKGEVEKSSIDAFQEAFKEFPVNKNVRFMYVTCDGWIYTDYKGKAIDKGHSNLWLERINRYESENFVNVLMVVDIGIMGVNIPSLVHSFVVRTSKATVDGEPVIKTPLQYLGRVVRLWLGGLSYEQVSTLKPDFQKWIWKTFNRYNITVPDTEPWKVAVEVWKEQYTVSVSQLPEPFIDTFNIDSDIVESADDLGYEADDIIPVIDMEKYSIDTDNISYWER